MNKPLPARNIGGYVPMIDGPEKVSGRAKYTADIVQPGQLAGRIFRSPYSHAEIVDVDISEALKIPGVIAIATAPIATGHSACCRLHAANIRSRGIK